MSMRQIMLWAMCSCLGVLGYKLILDYLKGNSTLLDSTSTIFSIFANALMVMRYREQWILWIIVDAVTVVMWLVAKDYLMTSMWAIFFCNAIYGFVTWSKSTQE